MTFLLAVFCSLTSIPGKLHRLVQRLAASGLFLAAATLAQLVALALEPSFAAAAFLVIVFVAEGALSQAVKTAHDCWVYQRHVLGSYCARFPHCRYTLISKLPRERLSTPSLPGVRDMFSRRREPLFAFLMARPFVALSVEDPTGNGPEPVGAKSYAMADGAGVLFFSRSQEELLNDWLFEWYHEVGHTHFATALGKITRLASLFSLLGLALIAAVQGAAPSPTLALVLVAVAVWLIALFVEAHDRSAEARREEFADLFALFHMLDHPGLWMNMGDMFRRVVCNSGARDDDDRYFQLLKHAAELTHVSEEERPLSEAADALRQRMMEADRAPDGWIPWTILVCAIAIGSTFGETTWTEVGIAAAIWAVVVFGASASLRRALGQQRAAFIGFVNARLSDEEGNRPLTERDLL